MNNANRMSLRLMRIDPLKYAIVATLAYLSILLIIYLPIILLGSLVGGASDLAAGAAMLGGGIIGIIFFIILAGAFVFIFTLIIAAILNFILKKVNGIDIDFEKVGLGISEIGNHDRLGQ